MTKEELAAKLTGMEYPVRISKELEAEAKTAGLVIVFGASDDLMEFRGAIYDEVGVSDDGTKVYLDDEGIMPHFDEVERTEEDLQKFFARKNKPKRDITALWCKEDDYSWTYETDIPHATFEVVEDGEQYCRGIVFDIREISNDDFKFYVSYEEYITALMYSS